MNASLAGDSACQSLIENTPYCSSRERVDGHGISGSDWYLSRREIEENSPSRGDGIDLKKEAYLRKSYCTFVQDLGMKLKVPQVTIATAIIFCHRFFLRQSHAKNDRRTIATVCMFLAGKVEETPRPLKDVILVSYEIINKKDPAAIQRIKQKEVYEQQKELILLGERVVLATLAFDFNVHHPYKPLVDAIKKFKVAQNALAQVAWNFVNDGLRTSLCLQFKPHHIAAGAIFLAAKFLKVKLPSDGDTVWWQEFNVSPRQLEEVSNQMLELYEQNRTVPPGASTGGGNSAGGSNHRLLAATHAAVDEQPSQNTNPHASSGTIKNSNTSTSRPFDHSKADVQNTTKRASQNECDDHGSKEPKPGYFDHGSGNNANETFTSRTNHVPERHHENPSMSEKDTRSERKESNSGHGEGVKGYSPMVSINKDKVKAALEKRRKSQSNVSRKIDLMDEDDLIERELENGIEIAAEDGKIKQDKKMLGWSKSLHGQESLNPVLHGSDNKPFPIETAEEGELSFDDREYQVPEHDKHKRKLSSPGKQQQLQIDGNNEGYDIPPHHQLPYSKHRDVLEDGMVTG
ncbi:Cyclin-T1-3 [Zostera marina]|uniref:Cyclin-T1-3 n=1 Tax=Zostera marina TaxID=29655 RepID=A0A0K9NTA9_ZOSMR|nr:Cyclin-T1-3 [Zostera marina]